MGDWVGRQLGNYQLTHFLGEGGFAEVYLGEHIHIGTQAAIKVLHTQLGGEDINKFRTEARTIARLLHPNIVRVLDFGVEGKIPFLVMDFASKGTLRDQHAKGKPIPLPTVVSYVKQVAEALQCAHNEKLVHRDVKPVNMLIGRNGEILLSDFGIATASQTSRQSTQDIIGTVTYMAPEQIQGKPRSASDQYSLGIAAYEWLTGDVPFHGSFTEIVAQHVAVPPPPLCEKIPSISPDVERVIMIALEKDPQKRFGSIQAFANALEQAGQESVPVMEKLQMPTVDVTVAAMSMKTFVRSSASTQHAVPLLPTKRVSRGTYFGHSNKINKVAWSSDSMLITSASDDKTIHVFEALTTRYLTSFIQHSHWVLGVAWSPHDNRIASASGDKTVQIWNASSGGDALVYSGHSHWVYAVAWSRDDRVIASVGADKTLHIWDTITANKILSYYTYSNIYTLAWSPDQKHIVSAGDVAQIWSISPATGDILTYYGHSGIIHTIAWSPDGKYIASGGDDRTIQIWKAATGETILIYRGHTDNVRELSWSPNGRYIASCSSGMMVQVWDVATGNIVCIFQHRAPVYTVAWSPDGRYIASGGDDKIVQIWVAPQ